MVLVVAEVVQEAVVGAGLTVAVVVVAATEDPHPCTAVEAGVAATVVRRVTRRVGAVTVEDTGAVVAGDTRHTDAAVPSDEQRVDARNAAF